MKRLSPEAQLDLLRRGTVEIITEEDLLAKLREGRPLRVKLGVDPSAPDIHLGIAIVLRKLRQFQDLGHEAILVVGDFTGLIGDPSEKKRTRPMLSREEIERNAATYREQYSRILDPKKTRVVFNSHWLGPMTFESVIRLAAKTTVARILERDDFTNRLKAGTPVFLHELLYPLCQAMDSVHLQADVELGGTDQKFNNLMGRDLQREFGQPRQVVMLTPLLVGTDGVEKMSKSLGNAIGITDPPEEMYGKAMSIPDGLIAHYMEFATDIPIAEVRAVARGLTDGRVHPREAKARLAREIVTMWHGADAALEAERAFERVFKARELPDEMREVSLGSAVLHQGRIRIVDLLVQAGLVASKSEARRLVSQGGVSVDGGRVEKPEAEVSVKDGAVVRVGRRRFARIRIREGERGSG
ncbi:MAG: tyrosine--tRNA ligase [Armatimonadota bacterium]|nr:tyrosine--tRNA ligase [Armatimonadota bacterium]MDR7452282.1 tyrosine--tRNA ligase [Armatimonadota bacterium]MDR7467954.1 tyrosine--tRNA ligase [Armatimonadota bacterium]MDR7494796.1 tyrosine--tRNA ligase [Armatimonadota bacterium]MDR7499249.1 tyrosine--tRNA ligase [Armatimonadota bacterium]